MPKKRQNSYRTREFSRKCSKKAPKQLQMPEKKLRQMFQKTAKTATNAGNFPENVPKNGRSSNKCRRKNSGKCSKSLNRHFLYSHVKKKSKLSQKTIKTLQPRKGIIARAMLRSGRSSAHASHNLVSKAQSHYSALPSSIETKADLACVESTLCFQL